MTSTPHFGRYLKRYIAFVLLLLIVVGAWSGRAMQESQQFHQLYLYQLGKLEKLSAAPATVFVGDSSLGNAIDAGVFGALAHAPAVNLALTGSYGYAGSYNMIRRVLKRFKPRNIVIIQAPDMMQREADDLANFMSVDGAGFELPSLAELPSVLDAGLNYLKLIYSLDVLKRSLSQKFGQAAAQDRWEHDYVGQRAQLKVTDALVARQSLAPGTNPDKLRYLEKIAELCRSEHINCIYAHGPLLDRICATSGAYLEEASRAIRGTGLPLVAGTPLCVPTADIGDAIDHVGPALKTASTQNYYRLLTPMLR